ncbi:MAG TPA: hypothetical protein VN641_00320 [Urbifossiella sp.]|nr:hypothetical protein [Urbifossiella sp.]
MTDDPIVAEVRKAREQLAARFNFDVDAIFADLQVRQLQWHDRLVKPKFRAQSNTPALPAIKYSQIESK